MTSESVAPVRLGLVIGLVAAALLAAVCGWLGYQEEEARQADHTRALLIRAAEQGAVNLTTIDYTQAEADVQRILESATGEFRDDFRRRSAPFIDVVKKARSKSVGTVTAAALESSDGQRAKVLVAVTVTTASAGAAESEPRYWRMRLTVDRDQDGAKVSDVDFVP